MVRVVLQGKMVQREKMVLLVKMAIKVHKEIKETKDSQAIQVAMERVAPQAPPVPKDLTVQKGKMVSQAHPVNVVNRDLLVLKVPKEILASLVIVVNQVHQGEMVRKAQKVHQDLKAPTVTAFQDLKELLVLLVLTVLLDPKVPRVTSVLQALKVSRVHAVLLEHLDLKVVPVLLIALKLQLQMLSIRTVK